jgi:hypothetical protein
MSFQSFTRGVTGWSAAVMPVLAMTAWLAVQDPAAAAGLFVGMEGSWRGEGTIDWKTGETERMRCTAKYEVENEGNKLIQSLTCATDSTRLVIKSTINYNPAAGAVTGTWSETSYGITGFVTGNAAPGKVQAQVKSADNRFTARVNVAACLDPAKEFRRYRSCGDASPFRLTRAVYSAACSARRRRRNCFPRRNR